VNLSVFLKWELESFLNNYNSLFIGKTKLENIQQLNADTWLIWYDYDDNSNLYFCKYDEVLNECNVACTSGKITRMIPKTIMMKGLEMLCESIRTL